MHARATHSIAKCVRCPRLREYCQQIAKEKRKSFLEQSYWGKPVENFGDSEAELLVVGLAPAAHGANRTGRMFTGDRSGQWLYRALYRAGFANQPTYESADDGLILRNCLITAVVHCAPPENKPTPEEIYNCKSYLDELIKQLQPKVIVALGAIAWNSIFDHLKSQEKWRSARPQFKHHYVISPDENLNVIGCFHPSQQNTFTKKLTEPMLDAVFTEARGLIAR